MKYVLLKVWVIKYKHVFGLVSASLPPCKYFLSLTFILYVANILEWDNRGCIKSRRNKITRHIMMHYNVHVTLFIG